MLALTRRHPWWTVLFLATACFTAGFYYEFYTEQWRVREVLAVGARIEAHAGELIAGHQAQRKLIAGLAAYARKRKVKAAAEIERAAGAEGEIPEPDRDHEVSRYLAGQLDLRAKARELVIALDADLPPGEPEFQSLYSTFNAQEQKLNRISAERREEMHHLHELNTGAGSNWLEARLHSLLH